MNSLTYGSVSLYDLENFDVLVGLDDLSDLNNKDDLVSVFLDFENTNQNISKAVRGCLCVCK